MRKGTTGIASLAIACGLLLPVGVVHADDAPSVSWPSVLPPSPPAATPGNAARQAQAPPRQQGSGIGVSLSGITTGGEQGAAPQANVAPSPADQANAEQGTGAATSTSHKKHAASHAVKAAQSRRHAAAPRGNQKARAQTDLASEQLRAEQAERVKMQSAKASAPAANAKVQSSPGATTD
jgi:hypothetical protein